MFQSLELKMSVRSSSEKRISKELVNLQKEPPPGCAATLKDKSVFEWVATVEGPPESPYQVACHVWFTSNNAE